MQTLLYRLFVSLFGVLVYTLVNDFDLKTYFADFNNMIVIRPFIIVSFNLT